jgi:hypothetical protein
VGRGLWEGVGEGFSLAEGVGNSVGSPAELPIWGGLGVGLLSVPAEEPLSFWSVVNVRLPVVQLAAKSASASKSAVSANVFLMYAFIWVSFLTGGGVMRWCGYVAEVSYCLYYKSLFFDKNQRKKEEFTDCLQIFCALLFLVLRGAFFLLLLGIGGKPPLFHPLFLLKQLLENA